jgi:citrate lyase beta subunit
MRVRRALLFMPGDERRKIEKGATLGADSVIMDLEDGVAYSRKQIARETIAAALREVDFGKTERLVRMNPVTSDNLYTDDLIATVGAHPDGYVLPKVESPEQIADVSARIMQAERENGWPAYSIRLLAIIETARGIVNLHDITARPDPRLDALMFGAEDLAGDIGAVRTPDGWEVFYGRSAVVIHARAAGLQAIDTVYIHLENLPGLMTDTEQAVYMGFTGKLAIHPRQVEPIQMAFTPKPEEIARAKRLIQAHDSHQAAGSGVFVVDGQMVDRPMIRAAEHVLARARAAGIE